MNTNPKPENSGTNHSGKFYPLTPELAKELRAIEHMPAGAWRLWSFLVTFEPFGNEYAELPELTAILAECNISKATFYRAIALFHEYELFDLQPTKMYLLNLRGQKFVSKMRHLSQKCDSESQKREYQSQKCNSESQNCESSKIEPAQDQGFSDGGCTNNRSKDLKEQQNSHVPPTHPVAPDIDKEGIGTRDDPLTAEVTALCTQITAAGIRPNKTIQTTIATLLVNEPAPAVRRLVENAISALQEQQQRGMVRNPGGFLNTALRRHFTANQAKRDARTQRQAEPPKPPNMVQVSLAIDVALRQHGDRAIALAKLQELWHLGWHDQIEELCILRKRDWGFIVTEAGIRDSHR